MAGVRGSLELAARLIHIRTVDENHVPVPVCRDPTTTVQEVWERNPQAGARSETRRPDV